MAVSYQTPNMNLVVPVPTEQSGPNWSFDLNASLTILDGHDHTPGSGVQVPTAGILINGDLSWNGAYNAVDLRSSRYTVNGSALALPSDLSCAYSSGTDGDLYWNDLNGNQIRITSGGAVAGATGTITGLPSGTASASFVSASGTFLFQQATSTAANIDVASVAIRYPGSYPTPTGNYIQLQAPSSLSSGYALTLPVLPGQTNVMTLTNTGTIASITYDAVGVAMTSVGANSILSVATAVTSGLSDLVGAEMTVSGANPVIIASTRTIGTALNNFFVSSSTGSFTTSSASYVNVTNAVVVGSFSGQKPVFVALQSSPGALALIATGGAGRLRILRNSSVNIYEVAIMASFTGPPSIGFIDYGIIGGGPTTYSYTLTALSSSGAIGVTNCVLVAYEIT